jgi:hypothetical protein
VLGEGVEERVARRVVRLPHPAERAGQRRVQDERGQVVIAGQLVQVEHRVDLRPEHVVQPGRRQRVDQAVVQDARGVHDGGQRVVRGDRGEHRGQPVPFGHVARRAGDLGSEVAELGDQVRRVGRGHPPAPDELQVPDAVRGHQVARHQPTQGAGGPGDQHGPRRVPRGSRCGRRGHPHQPGGQYRARPDGDLGFVGQCRTRHPRDRAAVVVDVDQHEPVGVLGLRGPDQAPDRGVGEVRRRLAPHATPRRVTTHSRRRRTADRPASPGRPRAPGG